MAERYGSVHAPHDEATAKKRAWKAAESRYGPVIHEAPPKGTNVMPCCCHTPHEVPKWHRMTVDPTKVTCGKSVDEIDAGAASHDDR